MESNKLIIVDENNIEKEMDILFTFDTDEGNKYVIYFDGDDEDGEYFSARYTDDGNLFPDISEEEWNMCFETLAAFMEDTDEEA